MRVASPEAIEKPCQLMMAFGLLVTVSVLPTLLKEADPETTEGPVGLAYASAAKQDATSAHKSLTRGARRNGNALMQAPCQKQSGLSYIGTVYAAGDARIQCVRCQESTAHSDSGIRLQQAEDHRDVHDEERRFVPRR